MQFRIWLALAISAIGWGTGGVATRAVLNTGVEPFGMLTIRGLLASILIILVLASKTEPLDRAFRSLRAGGVLGVTNLVAPFALYTFAYRYASAGFVSVIIALVPIATAGLAHLTLENEPLRAAKVVGLSIAFSGVTLLLVSGDSGLAIGGRPAIAGSLAVCGVLSIAFSNVFAKRRAATYDTFGLLATQFVVGSALLAVIALIAEGMPKAISLWSWSLIAYLAVVSTVVPYFLYYWLLRHVSSTRASTIGYLVPVVSLSTGVVLLDEKLELGIVAGGVIILIGVVLAHRAEAAVPIG